MMIPTMSDYATYIGSNLASLQQKMAAAAQTKTKSFRIEDILDIRDHQDQIYTGVRAAECEVSCYDKMRLDGKRIRGPRKDRTIFSKIQLFRLERRFHDQKYLSSYEKALIAHSLQLTQQQVQTWFQNRRAKAKREEREKKKQGRGGESVGTSSSFSPEDLANDPSTRVLPDAVTHSPPPPASTSLLVSPRPRNSGGSLSGSPSSSSYSSPPPSSSPLVSPVMRLVTMCSSIGSDLQPGTGSATSIASRVQTSPAPSPTAKEHSPSPTPKSPPVTTAPHRFSIDHLTSRNT